MNTELGFELILGNEAVALGAMHAGISGAYAYPGTPSTDLLQFIIDATKEKGSAFGHIAAHWCANEKTAYEQALGVSFVGKRALVAMKHVGLNVAADPFMSSSLVGPHAGFVLVVADDPGMHSSQNEQDSRFFADYAKIPCLEPRTHQECYDMAREAFELSERFQVPVMIRLVTRLAHSRGQFKTRAPRKENSLQKAPVKNSWVLMPANAKRQWHELLGRQGGLDAYVENSAYVSYSPGSEKSPFGVISTGLATEHYREVAPELGFEPPHLHIGAYPLPLEKIRALAARVQTLLVFEEGYPLLERQLRGIVPGAITVKGKQSAHVPLEGELTPDLIRRALELPLKSATLEAQIRSECRAEFKVPGRPPQLCSGCPHTDSFGFIKTALSEYGGIGGQNVVTSDIGCYTLGALAPHSAIESTVCMGASIGMAKGAADAGLRPAVAVIGDSTFLHSGISPLLDAVASRSPITVLILDNEAVAMTGGQDPLLPPSRIKDVVLGLGVEPEHVHVVPAHRRVAAENAALLKRELEHPGVSVIIAVRECVETAVRHKREREKAEALQ